MLANKANIQQTPLATRGDSDVSKDEKEGSIKYEVRQLSREDSASFRAVTRTIPPFIPAHDITRGVLQAVQTTLDFAFMLAVMCVSF